MDNPQYRDELRSRDTGPPNTGSETTSSPGEIRITNQRQSITGCIGFCVFFALGSVMQIQLALDQAPWVFHLFLALLQTMVLIEAVRAVRMEFRANHEQFLVRNIMRTYTIRSGEVCGVARRWNGIVVLVLKNGRHIPVVACTPLNSDSPERWDAAHRDLLAAVHEYGDPTEHAGPK
jgi:hypothetical protein